MTRALTLPYPPLVNHLWRYAAGGRAYLSPVARAYKQEVALIARAAGVEPLSGPLAVELRLYRPRKAGDIDGPIKAALDALNGVAWHDDKQITELHVYRQDDKADPRADIAWWPVKDREP